MHILNKKLNSKYGKNTSCFKGHVIENSCYRGIRKYSKNSSEYYSKIVKNIEQTLKKYPANYYLKIDTYKTSIPDTTQMGALKQGLHGWIKKTVIVLETPFNKIFETVDSKEKISSTILDFLKKLSNPLGELTNQLYPNLKLEHLDSNSYEVFKKRVIDNNTGKINYKEPHSVLHYIEGLVNVRGAAPFEVYEFLTNISSDPILSKEMARQFSEDPRKASSLKNTLINFLGGGEEGEDLFNTWYYDENRGYRGAYGRYYNEEIWDKATNLLDLVKQSPNLYTAAFRRFVNEKNIEPVLGDLPKEFGDRKIFSCLIQKLKTWNKLHNKEKKKKKPDEQKLATKFDLEVDNYKFNIQALQKGHSPKLKFIVKAPEISDESYILKFAPYDALGNTDRSKKFRDNQAIRPDMPYSDALIDFYLKENNCPNAPEIEFFDYEAQAVIYKETKGVELTDLIEPNLNLYRFRKFSPLADIYNLGVQINDIWKTNFLVNKQGNYILIDSGHSTYNNIFRPLVISKHIALANTCGREF